MFFGTEAVVTARVGEDQLYALHHGPYGRRWELDGKVSFEVGSAEMVAVEDDVASVVLRLDAPHSRLLSNDYEAR